MAKLRPVTPEHVLSSELQQGSPRSTGDGWEPDGLGYGKPRALTENSSGLAQGLADGGEREDAFARVATSGSLRTEPDMDTIMPLREAGQMVNVVSPASSEEVAK